MFLQKNQLVSNCSNDAIPMSLLGHFTTDRHDLGDENVIVGLTGAVNL